MENGILALIYPIVGFVLDIVAAIAIIKTLSTKYDCPKCGNKRFEKYYYDVMAYPDYSDPDNRGPYVKEKHTVRTCRKCGYRWDLNSGGFMGEYGCAIFLYGALGLFGVFMLYYFFYLS